MYKCIIREVKLHDIPQLRKINQECLPETYPYEYWEEVLKEYKHAFLVQVSKETVGYIIADHEYIISFAVLPKWRRYKIGTLLMQHLLHSLNSKVSLHVETSNTIAISFYERMGFVRQQLLPNYYERRGQDAYEYTYFPKGKYPKPPKSLKFRLTSVTSVTSAT